MFKRLSNSWELVKASWSVLVADKELLVFPLLSFVASIVVIISFIVPAILAGVFEEWTGIPIIGYVIGFLFYFVMYLISIFSNSALIGAAHIRLKGGDPTVADGFHIASSHMKNILGYAALSATVGILIRKLADLGIFGQIVSALGGLAWSVATFLAVPVLVIEGVGPIDAVKRSTTMLKETWGEQLIGNFGIGMVFGWLTFAVFVVTILFSIVFAVAGAPIFIFAVLAVAAFALLTLGLVNSALSAIYTTVVYQYAATGDTMGYIDPELIKQTFKKKKKMFGRK